MITRCQDIKALLIEAIAVIDQKGRQAPDQKSWMLWNTWWERIRVNLLEALQSVNRLDELIFELMIKETMYNEWQAKGHDPDMLFHANCAFYAAMKQKGRSDDSEAPK